MELNPFEKDVFFDFLRTIKRECTRLSEFAEESLKERQKTNILLEKLLQMLEKE